MAMFRESRDKYKTEAEEKENGFMFRANKLKYKAEETERKSNGYAIEFIKNFKAKIEKAFLDFKTIIETKFSKFEGEVNDKVTQIDEKCQGTEAMFDILSADFKLFEEETNSILEKKANKTDVYTKEEADTSHRELEKELEWISSELMTEAEAREKADNTKADKDNVYTKSEIDNKGYLTKHQDISGKADKDDVYTKTETDEAISEAIGNIEIPESSNGVGKKYLDKGEIFNDYENNIADTTNSHASGGKTVASGHGFKVIETSDNGDGTGTYTLNNVTGLEEGMTYSVRLSTARYNAGVITDITGNVVTVDNFKYIALDDEKTEPDNAEEFNVHNYFMIVGRPDLGELEVGFNAFASGENTIVSDRDGTGFGRDNLIIGQYGFGHGRNNIVGYAAYGGGRNNKALGDFSCTFGEGNEALAGYSDARGRSTKAKGMQSVTRGTGTIATATDQVVIGRYNTEDTAGDYLFIIGNGDKNTRSNALTLTKYGELWVKNNILIGGNRNAVATSDMLNGYAKVSALANYAPLSQIVGKRYSNGAEAFNASLSHIATGENAHVEGYKNEASGSTSHSEGHLTKALKRQCHAEGNNTTASGDIGSHAEGYCTLASGEYGSHAEGNNTIASGYYSHSEGIGTIATAHAQHAQGKYNIEDTANTYADIVGNGEKDKPSNAYTLDWNGNGWFSGNVEADAIILRSSNKKFRITIDDDGTLKATEVSG